MERILIYIYLSTHNSGKPVLTITNRAAPGASMICGLSNSALPIVRFGGLGGI